MLPKQGARFQSLVWELGTVRTVLPYVAKRRKEREGGREDAGRVGVLMTEGELGGGMSPESPCLCSASHPQTENLAVLQSLKCCHS